MAECFAFTFILIIFIAEITEGAKLAENHSKVIPLEEEGCFSSSAEHFPALPLPGGLTISMIIELIVVSYMFLLLVRVCDKHFVSCIKTIGKAANLSSDVAGATLMASAVSCPDLFINLIGTFVTHGDIGIGTIVGCGIFNTLAVPALCILITPNKAIRVRGWSLSRDSIFYFFALITLCVALVDNRIEWYEALVLVLIYCTYLFVLGINSWLKTKADSAINSCIRSTGKSERTSLLIKSRSILSYGGDDNDSSEFYPDGSFIGQLWYFLTLPIDKTLEWTVPKSTSTIRGYKLYPVTFIVCLLWIAVVSYIIAWFITIAGYQLRIPDSLVGLTFIAIGMSAPQAASSVIIAKQGDGAMALSNAIGSNIFDNLICLGFPWLLKCLIYEQNYVDISSKSISYSFIMLISSLIFLYTTVAANQFRLTQWVGLLLMGLYLLFAVLSVLLELNVFFFANLPFCS